MMAGAGTLGRLVAFGVYRIAAVERAAEWIDGAAEEATPHRHTHDLAGATDKVACLDRLGIVEENASERIPIKRGDKADLATLETHEFAKSYIGQSGNECDAIGDSLDAAHLFGDRRNLRRFDAFSCVGKPGVKISERARHGSTPREFDRDRHASCCG